MKRLVCSMLVALAAGAAPVAAQGTSLLKIGIQGGWVMPYSSAKTYLKNGYDGGLTLQIEAPLVPVGVRIDGLYTTMDGKPVTGGLTQTNSATTYSGTANIVWTVIGTGLPTKFYLIGGFGYYDVSQKITVSSVSQTVSSSGFGYNAGLGMRFTKFFVEARWTNINGGLYLNSTSSKSLQIVPINVGFIF
jgi:hypothetical protein